MYLLQNRCPNLNVISYFLLRNLNFETEDVGACMMNLKNSDNVIVFENGKFIEFGLSFRCTYLFVFLKRINSI